MEKNIILNPSGKCVLCAEQSGLVCQRCGDFYCGKDCQIRDWQRHRYICAPLPALVHPNACSALGDAVLPMLPLSNVVTKKAETTTDNNNIAVDESNAGNGLEKKQDQLKCTSQVKNAELQSAATDAMAIGNMSNCDTTNGTIPKKMPANNNKNNKNVSNVTPPNVTSSVESNLKAFIITGFRGPNNCSVREDNELNTKNYNDILHKINLLGKNQPKAKKLKRFSFVIAEYNDMYYRGKIIATRNDYSVRLLFIDLGIVRQVNITNLKEIRKEIIDLPCYINPVMLLDVSNYALSTKIQDFLNQFVGAKFIAKRYKSNKVELFHSDTHQLLNAQIREFCADMPLFKAPNTLSSATSTSSLCTDSSNKSNVAKATDFPLANGTVEFMDLKKSSSEESKTTGAAQGCTWVNETVKKIVEAYTAQKPNEINESIKLLDFIDFKTSSSKESETTGAAQGLKIKEDISSGDTSAFKDKLDDVTASEVFQKNPGPTLLAKLNSSMKSTAIQVTNDNTAMATNPVLLAPFPMPRLNVNPDIGLDVFIVDNKSISRGKFGAFDSTKAKDFTELHDLLAEFKDANPYRPVLREYVIAKFEDAWCRAKILDIKAAIPHTIYTVLYLEFTSSGDVTEEQIRRYPASLTVPCNTSVCLIEGFPHKLNKAQLDLLEEKMQMHSVLHLDSVRYLHDLAVIKCKTLTAALNEKA
ncbi:uncharacterized protein LOC117134960 [Drosophila busckii]|uniref:uncharacterized protein LOC117134960 n=1 Tax=Drosophila busckii TaxID=30019 RepID=UPI001432DF67|nr:uncharacterized protein LOC117134960 [Drosophila busckii]